MEEEQKALGVLSSGQHCRVAGVIAMCSVACRFSVRQSSTMEYREGAIDFVEHHLYPLDLGAQYDERHSRAVASRAHL